MWAATLLKEGYFEHIPEKKGGGNFGHQKAIIEVEWDS
jgi:hypothetical protein